MAKSIKNAPLPPWMLGAQKINDQNMIVVHMNNGELEGLDNLQGGPSVDEATGIREYSALGPIIEMPEIQKIFHQVNDEIGNHGDISPGMKKIYETTKEHSLPYRETEDEEHNPLKAMEKTGRDGDKKLAFIPLNLAYFLIELRHVPSVNPKTGLLEFKPWYKKLGRTFRNVVRVAGTIGGAVFGGPLGAGAGRALAGMVTGQRLPDAFRSGLTHMGRAGIVSGIGGLANSMAPGIGQAIGGHLPGAVSNAASQFFTGPMSTMGMLNGVGNAIGMGSGAQAAAATQAAAVPGSELMLRGSAAAKLAATEAAKTAAQTGGGLGGLLGKAAGWAPLAMTGIGMLGERQKHKEDRKRHREHEDKIARYQEEMGYNRDLGPVRKARKVNPGYFDMDPEAYQAGHFPSAFLEDEEPGYFARGGLVKSYSKGTLVKGPGKGQADLIKTSVPEGSYIIDASSTSAFGDGSSSAGAEVLKQFENQIKRKYPQKFVKKVEKVISTKTKQVPVWLSNDEYKFDPVTVTLLGEGSNKRGADALKKAVIKLRKHKISKGDELPPKAKHPSYYIPNGRF